MRAAGGKGSAAAAGPQLPAAPLPPVLFAASGTCPRKLRGRNLKEGRAPTALERSKMDQDELNELKEGVPCAAVLDDAGYAIDLKESTRRTLKYRRGDEIVIVIHDGKGWFDPLSDAKGDVFSLMSHLNAVGFPEAKLLVARLVDYQLRQSAWKRRARPEPDLDVAARWSVHRKPWPGSRTWRYLRDERHLPEAVICSAIRHDLLREGPYGSMWAAHRDGGGLVTGWEERGPQWRGFATGGAKVLFRFGAIDARRLCVTEAAIDAMSLAGAVTLIFRQRSWGRRVA